MGFLDFFRKKQDVDYDKILAALNRYMSKRAAWYKQDNTEYIEKGYLMNDNVYSVIRLLTRAASTLPVYVYKVVDKKSYNRYKSFKLTDDYNRTAYYQEKSLELADGHWFNKVLERPNALQAWPEFVENVLGYKYLLGNTYILGLAPETGPNKGRVKEMTVLPSQYTEIVPGSYGVEKYKVTINGIEVEIPEEKICHLKTWSPDYSGVGTHLYGISPIRAGARKVRVSNDGTDYMATMLQNMGMFGLFKIKDGAVAIDEQKARALEQTFYRKQRQKGRVMFTGADFVWESAGMSPVDLALIESAKMTLRDICSLYSVSSQLLNDPDNKTYNNMKEARKAMWTNAVLPDFNSFIKELNRWALKDEGYVVDYDIRAIPELQEDMERLVGYVEKMYWATLDEKRTMTGLDLSGGKVGEKYHIPANLIEIDKDGKDLPDEKMLDELFGDHIERGRY